MRRAGAASLEMVATTFRRLQEGDVESWRLLGDGLEQRLRLRVVLQRNVLTSIISLLAQKNIGGRRGGS